MTTVLPQLDLKLPEHQDRSIFFKDPSVPFRDGGHVSFAYLIEFIQALEQGL